MSGYVQNDLCGDRQRLEAFDYEDRFDLLGDGRLQLLSTIGHSGDAVYNQAQLDELRPPGLADARHHCPHPARSAVVGRRRRGGDDDLGGSELMHRAGKVMP